MEYYLGLEKGVVRSGFTNFISDNFSYSRIRNAKVLTLLGPTNRELEQVWDRLGVQRQNITVIEKDPKIHAQIASKNLGVDLLPLQSIDEYLQGTNNVYDIMNLDYTGNLSNEKIMTLDAIGSKLLLGDDGIIATWYSGQRERQEPFSSMMIHYFKTLHTVLSQEGTLAKAFMDSAIKNISHENILKSMYDLSKGNIPRDEGLTVATHFYLGNLASRQIPPVIEKLHAEETICKLVEANSSYKEMDKELLYLVSNNLDPTRRGYSPELVSALKRLRFAALNKGEKLLKDRLTLVKEQSTTVLLATTQFLSSYLKKYDFFRKLKNYQQYNLIQFLARSGVPDYLPLANKKFKYTGDGHTPMFVDMNYVKNFDMGKILPVVVKPSGKLRLPEKMISSQKFWRKLNSFATEYHQGLYNTIKFPFKDRIEVSVEIIRSRLLDEFKNSKVATYSLLKFGKSYEEINQIFPEFSLKQLPRMKAVQTMREKGIKFGRPKKQYPVKENVFDQQTQTPVAEFSNGNLSNDDIKLLLEDKYTPLDIATTFDVNVWRVRGIKANMTRQKNTQKREVA